VLYFPFSETTPERTNGRKIMKRLLAILLMTISVADVAHADK
jgi:hypothetical protein